jgi:hypothetical protein
MGTPITDYVDLSISIASAGIPAPSLAKPLLIGYFTQWATDLVREYSSLSAMAADGLDGTTVARGAGVYRMAQALMAQTPAPTSFKVGRLTVGHVHSTVLTALTDTVGETITVTIEGPTGLTETYTRTCAGGGIPAEATALAALINAGVHAADITATPVGADVTIIKDAVGGFAGQIYYYSGLKNLDINDNTPDLAGTAMAAQIANIRLEDDDWYGVALDSPGDIIQEALAAAVLPLTPNIKCAFLSTQDSACRNGTAGNILKVLAGANNTRAFTMYSPHGMDEYPGVALMSRMIGCNPGATTAAYQQLAGVTRAGVNAWDLSAAQLALIRTDRGNVVISLGTLGMVDGQAGWMAAQRYLDERLLLDWLSLNIPVELVNAILSRTSVGSKIPYTNEAAEVARGAIYKILATAEGWGAVQLRDPVTGENYFSFSYTDAAAQTSGNRLARIFAGINFGCVITGAAQRFVVRGTLNFV